MGPSKRIRTPQQRLWVFAHDPHVPLGLPAGLRIATRPGRVKRRASRSKPASTPPLQQRRQDECDAAGPGRPANDVARSEILLGRVRDRDVDVRRAESGGRGHWALEAEATTDSGGRTTTTRRLGMLHGSAGNTLALLRRDANDALAAETAAVLTRHPFRENSLANRPSSPLLAAARAAAGWSELSPVVHRRSRCPRRRLGRTS